MVERITNDLKQMASSHCAKSSAWLRWQTPYNLGMMNSSTPQHDHQDGTHRLRLVIRGAVQGVGFRPYIYRLADELKLRGYVTNTAQGVVIDIEQDQRHLISFWRACHESLPPRAFIQSCEVSHLDPLGQKSFEIRTQHRRRQQDGVRPPRYRHLSRLPARHFRFHQPTLSLPIHQLHQLRTTILRSLNRCRTIAPTRL